MWAELAKVYHLLNGGEGAATILVAVVALAGVLASILVSYVVASRGVYINAITAERNKWIEKLRVNLAAYSASYEAAGFAKKVVEHTDDLDEILIYRGELQTLSQTGALIQLQLNPRGEIDANILRLIKGTSIRSSNSPSLAMRAGRLLVAHSQWLLKAEWERVKAEAGSPIRRFVHSRSAKRHLREYRNWVEAEGAIDPLLEEFEKDREQYIAEHAATDHQSTL
jgi:hypothetical protein